MRKKSILKSILYLLIGSALSISCSSDDGNQNNPPPAANENTWTLDTNNFIRSNSTQTATTYTSGEPFTIVNVDSNFNNNQIFKTCNFIPTFNTHTTGTYTVKSQNTVFSNVTLKTMYIKCFVSNGLGNGAMYESMDSDLTATVTQVDGKSVVTITEPVTLTRTYNDNFPQAPQTFTLTCNKVR
ncbi:MAG: hypothetical protein M0D53_11985 [Flavobacterium sp. JAD_PAG50586_2]|nr:MAG: hypothetical protein M0D53_11985 [Flavobacterium sp. JAD_PAG50586_2]